MGTAIRWKRYQPRRSQIFGGILVLVACVVYFSALHMLDGRAEAYLKDLRNTDVTRYLTVLRGSRGFDTYLEEYRDISGYEEFEKMPPAFLVGRWTQRPGTIRLTPGTAPAECRDPMTLGYGLYLPLDSAEDGLAVSYRIDGKTVEMRTETTGTIPIHLVSYGGQLDHIEFVPPGQDDTVYAYLCGR